jgi:hypothetical protein
MPLRTIGVLIAFLLSGVAPGPQPTATRTDPFSGPGRLELTLTAPLQQLFKKGYTDEKYTVPGTLTYIDAATGSPTVLRDLAISVRGHTSRDESECTFPKLKIAFAKGAAKDRSIFAGLGALKVGTHCGDTPGETLTRKFGRLANANSPQREALVYALLQTAEVPTLRTRPARITYVDPAGGNPLVRPALLVEDDQDAMKRLHGTQAIAMEAFGDVRSLAMGDEARRVAFGEAMVGNFDWCLKYTADDEYRCDASKPLWNMSAFERADGPPALVLKDFDIAGMVVGHHIWFSTVFNPAFVPSKSEIEIEALAQIQRTRTLFSRVELDAERHAFLARKTALYATVEQADVDPHGRELARAYLDAFFAAIGSDEAFYRAVVTQPRVQVYADAARSAEACGDGDQMRVGTPVNVLQRSGSMSQVVVLDALWRWAPPRQCETVQRQPVWIASDAISTDFPPSSPRK